MSLLTTISDIFLGGGATGVISGGISMWAKLRQQKQEHEHKEKEWIYTLNMTRENAKHESMLADKQLLISQQVGADQMRIAAIQSEAKLAGLANVSGWVNNLRSLHRLVLTYVLILGAFWMHYAATSQAGEYAAPNEMQILLTVFITNAAASAVGFWFGDRVVTAIKR